MKLEAKNGLVALTAVSLAALALYLAVWFLFDGEAIKGWLNALSQRGKPFFLSAAVLAASVSVPRQFIALAAGASYGWLDGVLLCSLAVLVGNFVQFFVARALLRPILRRRAAKHLAKIDKIARLGPFKIILMLRLLPAGHSGMINLAAGAGSIAALPFLGASYLGQLPQNIIFSLLGDGFSIGSGLRLSIAGVLFLVSLCLGLGLYKKHRTILSA